MSVSLLVLVIFPQTDEAFPQSLDIHQAKLEKQTTSAARMKNGDKILTTKNLKIKKEQNIKTKPKNQQNSLRKKGKKLESVKLY